MLTNLSSRTCRTLGLKVVDFTMGPGCLGSQPINLFWPRHFCKTICQESLFQLLNSLSSRLSCSLIKPKSKAYFLLGNRILDSNLFCTGNSILHPEFHKLKTHQVILIANLLLMFGNLLPITSSSKYLCSTTMRPIATKM